VTLTVTVFILVSFYSIVLEEIKDKLTPQKICAFYHFQLIQTFIKCFFIGLLFISLMDRQLYK